MTDPWFECLAPCEALVPCGQGRHVIRWEAGALTLASHADPEAELVLAALGGEKARCVEVAQAWGRHAEDLSVLAIGPRGPDDAIAVGWDDVDAAVRDGGRGPMMPPSGPRAAPMRLASPAIPTAARAQARRHQAEEEMERITQRRNDMLSLLALGYGFQVRLIGQVAQANADRPDEAMARVRPPLVAAMTARLAPVAEEWLGIDPDQVVVSLHRGPGGARGGRFSPGGSRGDGSPRERKNQQGRGWGSVELTGRGEQRRLMVSLPAGWLGRVWAAGLPLIGRHLVVAVERGGWPDARVLGLRAPGTEPVPLDVHAVDGASGAGDAPHWEL